MTPLRIAFLASELAPFAKTGGLADVARALPRTLSSSGHDVRVFVPLYGVIDAPGFGLSPLELEAPSVRLGADTVPFSIRSGSIPDSQTPVYFIDCPVFFRRSAIYTNDPDEPLRFVFFCHAVFETCQRLGFSPDVFHCNDWQTALVPLMGKTAYAWDRLFEKSRSLLTVHNLAYQGAFSSDVLGAIGVGDAKLFDPRDLAEGRVNFLKTGLFHADLLSTVSPTYAREIQTPEQGYALDGVLRQRSADLVGILNGVDYQEWDPAHDSHIPYRYSEKSFFRKRKNKEALLSEFGLSFSESVPLIGMIGRLSYQKGIELLYDALPELLSRETFQLIVLGTGEARYREFFEGLERGFRRQVRFYHGFHETLAHLIEAASDMFLMPSRYEPCGLNQMYSLRYGSVPIVRKTGGLADSVRPFDPATGDGTGIVFEHFTPAGVRWALETALALHRDAKLWRLLVRNGMVQDFSWEHSAEEYLAVYRRLLIK